MIKNIIALYPGRFQPFGQHHAAAFKWLQKQFGAANTYIVTSNVVQPPKSPFSFKEKQDIIRQYGFDDRLVQVKSPYKSEEILQKLNPADTAVVFMVGAKDMKEDPRFAMKPKKDGSPSYFQSYDKNKSMAALALVGVTVWLWRTYRQRWVWFVTGLPAVAMYVMSMWALLRFVRDGFLSGKGMPTNPVPWAALVLVGLAVLVLVEAVISFTKTRRSPAMVIPLTAERSTP